MWSFFWSLRTGNWRSFIRTVETVGFLPNFRNVGVFWFEVFACCFFGVCGVILLVCLCIVFLLVVVCVGSNCLVLYSVSF